MFSFLKKKEERPEVRVTELKAFVSGKVIPIEEVPDEVFSSKALGNGIAIEPDEDVVTAPCDGEISVVMSDSKHAVGMILNNGADILIHEGLDTVEMAGEGFELYVKEGQKVKAGDKLLKFNPELIKAKGYGTVCILVLTNDTDFPDVKFLTGMDVHQGEDVVVKF